MHVLLLPSWLDTVDKPWRGTFFRDQARALARQGVRAGMAFVERRSLGGLRPREVARSHFQIAFDDGELPTARLLGWSIAAQTIPGGLLWCALMRRVARRYAERYGTPDVVHGHAVMWGGVAARLVARDLGVRYVVTEHSSRILTGPISPARRRLAAAAYDGAAAVVAVSRALKASVDRVAGDARAVVIPNTVDTAYFAPPARGRRAHSRFRFLMVGDVIRSKRADMAVRALAQLAQRGTSATLTIVGAGNQLEPLRRLAREEGVGEVVDFAGPLGRDGVRAAMQRADALLLPSDAETFGVVLIEALATGLPVIATRCGGPAEIVTADNGILIDVGDEGQLASAMRRMTQRRFASAAIRTAAEARFGYEAVGRRLVDFYDRVLDRAGQDVYAARSGQNAATGGRVAVRH